jgi:hypothetical protein
MRVNIYSEEVTSRVELRTKPANDVTFTGIQFFVGEKFEHAPGDDDSSAVTFWFKGKRERGLLRTAFKKALLLLDDRPKRR